MSLLRKWNMTFSCENESECEQWMDMTQWDCDDEEYKMLRRKVWKEMQKHADSHKTCQRKGGGGIA